MRFSLSAKAALVSMGAIASSLLVSLPATAELASPQRLADNHGGMTEDSAADTMDSSSSAGTIVEVASGSSSFETLVQAVQAAGLVDTLNGDGPFTVFAPTDDAFSQLPDGALDYLLQPENQDVLVEILKYHVVPGSITSDEITTGGISALGGGIAVAVRDNRVIVNDGSVMSPDIQASNGVIHGITRVLIPISVRQQLSAALN